MNNPILLIIGFTAACSVSCRSTRDISGTYTSRFAVIGYFSTSIRLLSDSSFTYRERGDMMFDTSSGHYTVKGRYLILYHEPFKLDSTEVSKYGKEMVVSSYGLSINNHLAAPEKYLIKSDKLFVCNESGKVERRKYGRSRHKRFFIFGSDFSQGDTI